MKSEPRAAAARIGIAGLMREFEAGYDGPGKDRTAFRVILRQNSAVGGGDFVVKRKRFIVEQINPVLKQAQLGAPIAMQAAWGVYDPTERSGAGELKELPEEN